ncbi:MAG: integral rane protein, partial [Thermomicrobiales bacterium]|nr:integral rane protein [Thermomicrobiales bacterium]
LYQREALWIGFEAAAWKPNAVKIGVGGVNAITGVAWDDRLRASPQDYLVSPPQVWLDGVNSGDGSVHQFVGIPLGMGYTLEAQVTDAESMGGIQILVFEPRPGQFPDRPPEKPPSPPALRAPVMGLGAGGQIRQKLYADPHGVETWDADNLTSTES